MCLTSTVRHTVSCGLFVITTSPRMLLSFATCTYSVKFFSERHSSILGSDQRCDFLTKALFQRRATFSSKDFIAEFACSNIFTAMCVISNTSQNVDLKLQGRKLRRDKGKPLNKRLI